MTDPTPKPRRKGSKLDKYADQIMAWRLTLSTPQIAAKLAQEPYNMKISTVGVFKWLRKRTSKETALALRGGDIIKSVTIELIEHHFGRQLAEFEKNYDDAIQIGDQETAATWASLWERAARDIGDKYYIKPQQIQAVQVNIPDLVDIYKRMREEEKR